MEDFQKCQVRKSNFCLFLCGDLQLNSIYVIVSIQSWDKIQCSEFKLLFRQIMFHLTEVIQSKVNCLWGKKNPQNLFLCKCY